MAEHVPVLVVGGGPVGLALAGDLGWRGISSLLVERRTNTVFQPKMDMVGIRTMEFCRRWGIVEAVEHAGYNRGYIQDCAWVTDLNGFEFGREHFPAPRDEQSPPQSPQHRERCPQNFPDPVLGSFAASTGNSEVRYRTELLDVENRDDHARATLRDTESGAEYQVQADYVVGCDGGDSVVRQQLGIAMSGQGALTYTTNAIFRCSGFETLHTMAPAYRYIFIGPEGTWATLVAINGRDEWRFSLIGDIAKRELSQDDMRAAIIRAVGREFDFEILSMLPWIRRQLVADRYREGRIFIAGDAAHLTSPTGGFGMNTGILDAVNLSWKLSAILQGWGGEALLESYEYEQRPVAVRNVNEAGSNLRRMLASRVAQPDPAMFDATSSEAENKRKSFGVAYTEAMKREWFSIGIHLGYSYEGSPVIVPDGSPREELEVSAYTPSARPGSRAPHFWLSNGRSILDEFGREFAVLRFDPTIDLSELESTATSRGIPLKALDVPAESQDLYDAPLVVVRPDGQVAWRGSGVPSSPAEMLSRIAGLSTSLSA